MKIIALTLAALFLATTAVPAQAATRSTHKTTTVKTALIPGANGCCVE